MTLNNLFEDTLRKIADVEIERLTTNILSNAGINTIEQYRYLLGQIDALRFLLPNMCQEANRLIAEN